MESFRLLINFNTIDMINSYVCKSNISNTLSVISVQSVRVLKNINYISISVLSVQSVRVYNKNLCPINL